MRRPTISDVEGTIFIGLGVAVIATQVPVTRVLHSLREHPIWGLVLGALTGMGIVHIWVEGWSHG